MTLLPSSAHPLTIERAGRSSPMILIRMAVAVIVELRPIATAFAAGGPVLKQRRGRQRRNSHARRPDRRRAAGRRDEPLFRAPALGETGTIQVARIIEAARLSASSRVDTGARTQVVVTRAARRITAAEIEAAVKRTLAAQHGTDAPAAVDHLRRPGAGIDGRTRFPAAAVGDRPHLRPSQPPRRGRCGRGSRHAPRRRESAARRSTQVEVAVLTRPLARGEAAQASDFAVEKRVRETLPADVQVDAHDLAGRVARRALHAGCGGALRRPGAARDRLPRRHRHHRLRGTRHHADPARPSLRGGRRRGHDRGRQSAVEEDPARPSHRARQGFGQRAADRPHGSPRSPPPSHERASSRKNRHVVPSASPFPGRGRRPGRAPPRRLRRRRPARRSRQAPCPVGHRGPDRAARLQAGAHADAQPAAGRLRVELAVAAGLARLLQGPARAAGRRSRHGPGQGHRPGADQQYHQPLAQERRSHGVRGPLRRRDAS